MYKILTLNARRRKLHCYKRHSGDLIMYIFKILNTTALLFPRYVTVSFYSWKFQ